ncbi:MAG: DUF938 domain-containing protein [Pseudomonadota bacterium]
MIRKPRAAEGTRTDGASGLATAPSAARNLAPILDVLLPRLPSTGDVLELASGTGQHIAAFAAHRPDLTFHPTDPDPDRRAAIDARCKGLPNVAEAGDLDVGVPGWAVKDAAQAIVVVNLLHLISDAEMSVMLDEAAQALSSGGVLAIYGPFQRGGRLTSDGDAAFHAALQADDPAIGYKDLEVVETVLGVLGFTYERHEMPANNILLIAKKVRTGGATAL